MRSYLSDPILLKPSTSDFLGKWTGNNAPISTTETMKHINQQLKEMEKSCKKLSDFEKLKQERKQRRRMKRRESMLIANQRIVVQELNRRRNSAPALTTFDLTEKPKSVSFSSNTHDNFAPMELKIDLERSSCRPILSKKNRTASLPLDHMDMDAFLAFKKAAKMRNEALECYAPSQKRNSVPWIDWSTPTLYLKTALFGCFNSRQNKTHPRKMLVFVLTPEEDPSGKPF